MISTNGIVPEQYLPYLAYPHREDIFAVHYFIHTGSSEEARQMLACNYTELCNYLRPPCSFNQKRNGKKLAHHIHLVVMKKVMRKTTRKETRLAKLESTIDAANKRAQNRRECTINRNQFHKTATVKLRNKVHSNIIKKI